MIWRGADRRETDRQTRRPKQKALTLQRTTRTKRGCHSGQHCTTENEMHKIATLNTDDVAASRMWRHCCRDWRQWADDDQTTCHGYNHFYTTRYRLKLSPLHSNPAAIESCSPCRKCRLTLTCASAVCKWHIKTRVLFTRSIFSQFSIVFYYMPVLFYLQSALLYLFFYSGHFAWVATYCYDYWKSLFTKNGRYNKRNKINTMTKCKWNLTKTQSTYNNVYDNNDKSEIKAIMV